MASADNPLEDLLTESVEHATWAAGFVCTGADMIDLVTTALQEAYVAAATLAIYQALGDRGDVELLKLTHAVRDRMRRVTCEVQRAAIILPEETVPGVRLPEAGS